MLGNTLSLSVGKRVSLPTGLAIPALSLAETGDNEISYTIGEVSGANQYRVEKSTDGVTYTLLATQSTHGTYTDGGLTEGQTYYYRVRAEDTVTSEVSAYRVANLTLFAEFLTTTLTDSTNLANNSNTFTLTVQPDTALSAGSSITLSGLTGSATGDGSLTISGAGASIFGSAGSWTQSTGTLVLTVDTAQTLPTGSDTVVTFTLTNSASSSGVTSVNLSSSGFTTASISGLFLEASANKYNIPDSTDQQTEATIIALSPTNPSGEVTVKFGSDTYDLYVWDGSAWYIYREDFMSPIFDGQLTFPDIQVFDTEAEFIDQTDAPNYTIVHAKDTDKLYVWDGSNWHFYNND
jgi:hypothetical protein